MNSTSLPPPSCEAFEQALGVARTSLVHYRFDKDHPLPLLKICLDLPAPNILAKWLEDLKTRVNLDLRRCDPETIKSDHGLKIITAHRAYPNRDHVVLTFTLPIFVWETVQRLQLSAHITFLGLVAEPDVVGDTQLTHLLNRAVKRTNEGPILGKQFVNDLERMKRARSDGLQSLPSRHFTFPRVVFTASLRTDMFAPALEYSEDRVMDMSVRWSADGALRISNGVRLNFISEVPSEHSSEVTLVIANYFWPYLEATSEVYRFVRYLDEQQCNELLPNN